MRKQDRIANQQQSHQQPQQPETRAPQGSRPQEQMKGSAPREQSGKPERQPGKLPLPD